MAEEHRFVARRPTDRTLAVWCESTVDVLVSVPDGSDDMPVDTYQALVDAWQYTVDTFFNGLIGSQLVKDPGRREEFQEALGRMRQRAHVDALAFREVLGRQLAKEVADA